MLPQKNPGWRVSGHPTASCPMTSASGVDVEVNCFSLDKEGVHLLILLQVQDQFLPFSHYPELSFEWMLKATTTKKNVSSLKVETKAPRAGQRSSSELRCDSMGSKQKSSIVFQEYISCRVRSAFKWYLWHLQLRELGLATCLPTSVSSSVIHRG